MRKKGREEREGWRGERKRARIKKGEESCKSKAVQSDGAKETRPHNIPPPKPQTKPNPSQQLQKHTLNTPYTLFICSLENNTKAGALRILHSEMRFQLGMVLRGRFGVLIARVSF